MQQSTYLRFLELPVNLVVLAGLVAPVALVHLGHLVVPYLHGVQQVLLVLPDRSLPAIGQISVTPTLSLWSTHFTHH